MSEQLCVWIPDWPVAAAISAGMASADQAIAIHNGRRIIAASAPARRAGVRRGMRRRQATALCPQLVVIADDETRQARTFEAVLSAIEQVVAFPVVLRPGLVVAAARGPVGHCGGRWQTLEAISRAIVEIAGAEAGVGIAHGTLAAILAARSDRVVAKSETATFLAAMPLRALTLVASGAAMWEEIDTLVARCNRFGITTLGEFFALPKDAIATRFGSPGLLAHDLAGGKHVLLEQLSTQSGQVSVAREYDPPLGSAQHAAFVARALGEQLLERLGGNNATHLQVSCRTTAGSTFSRCWMLTGAHGAKALSLGAITDRVRWQLDAWVSASSERLDGHITAVELCASGVGSLGPSGIPLWGQGDETARAERAAERLQALCGTDAVLRAERCGGRHPEAQVSLQPLIAPRSKPATNQPWPGQIPGPAPSRLYHRALPICLFDQCGNEIAVPALSEAWISAPASYRLATAPAPLPAAGEVESWAGPWPLVERWWSAQARARLCLQLVPASGAPLLIGTKDGSWVVEGCYD